MPDELDPELKGWTTRPADYNSVAPREVFGEAWEGPNVWPTPADTPTLRLSASGETSIQIED